MVENESLVWLWTSDIFCAIVNFIEIPTANIIGPPTAHVIPVGSGIHNIIKPIFEILLPGAGPLLELLMNA